MKDNTRSSVMNCVISKNQHHILSITRFTSDSLYFPQANCIFSHTYLLNAGIHWIECLFLRHHEQLRHVTECTAHTDRRTLMSIRHRLNFLDFENYVRFHLYIRSPVRERTSLIFFMWPP